MSPSLSDGLVMDYINSKRVVRICQDLVYQQYHYPVFPNASHREALYKSKMTDAEEMPAKWPCQYLYAENLKSIFVGYSCNEGRPTIPICIFYAYYGMVSRQKCNSIPPPSGNFSIYPWPSIAFRPPILHATKWSLIAFRFRIRYIFHQK